jgi:CheY-like chemotaxis protein
MSTSQNPLRILVIDDDPIMTEILTLVLSLQGHEIRTADSGESGLYLVAEQPLDVILTDLQLPGLRGPALVAALRKVLRPPTLLLGMSGTRPPDADLHAFDAFLTKPFTVEDFAAAVESAKAGSPKPAQSEAERSDPGSQNGGASTEPVLDENIFARMSAQLKPDQLGQLYALTVSDIRKRIELMREAEAAGDRETLHREAHSIKGGCGMVGATELYRLAATKEGGSLGSTPTLAEFTAACDRLQRMLDARLK